MHDFWGSTCELVGDETIFEFDMCVVRAIACACHSGIFVAETGPSSRLTLTGDPAGHHCQNSKSLDKAMARYQ